MRPVTQWLVLGLDAPAGRRESGSGSTAWLILGDGQQGATQLRGSLRFNRLQGSNVKEEDAHTPA